MEHKEKLSECEEMILSILLESNKELILPEIMEKAKDRFGKEWKMQLFSNMAEMAEFVRNMGG